MISSIFDRFIDLRFGVLIFFIYLLVLIVFLNHFHCLFIYHLLLNELVN